MIYLAARVPRPTAREFQRRARANSRSVAAQLRVLVMQYLSGDIFFRRVTNTRKPAA